MRKAPRVATGRIHQRDLHGAPAGLDHREPKLGKALTTLGIIQGHGVRGASEDPRWSWVDSCFAETYSLRGCSPCMRRLHHDCDRCQMHWRVSRVLIDDQ